MAIKNFSEDGASGAGGDPDGTGAIPTGGAIADDSGMAGEGSGFQPASSNDSFHPNLGTAAPMSDANMQAYATARRTPASPTPSGSPFGGPAATHMGGPSGFNAIGNPSAFNAIGNPLAYNSLAMFADGGSVDDGSGDSSGDVGSLLALALSSVDAGLDYGRKKYGLSQDKGQQQAAMGRTPAIPGNQSESGIPRPQPMPGPLPPTSNPFGQRRQFGQNDQDQDDQGTQTAQAGAIPDNDEDDQEGTA